MEIKVYQYVTNAKSKEYNKNIVLFAISKNEMLKFCKNFDGLKVTDKLKGNRYVPFSSDDLMRKQKELFERDINNGTIEIVKEWLENDK